MEDGQRLMDDGCLATPRFLLILKVLSNEYYESQNVAKLSKMSYYVPKHPKISQNVPKCPKRLKAFQNVTKQPQLS